MVNINDNIIIQRAAEEQVKKYLEPNKVVVVYGPRRSGKTTLLRQIERSLAADENILWLEGELNATHASLEGRSIEKLKSVVGSHTLVIIDEAQAVPDIGLTLKLMVDHLPGVKVIASGSATFDLARTVGEPLVGRKWTVWLYPLWYGELQSYFDYPRLEAKMDDALIYGSYPQLLHLPTADEKRRYVEELVDTALYKDILELDSVRNSGKIRDLLQMLALQVGQEVSLHELATALEMGTATVERYLDLLEQCFVLLNVRGLSRNLRKEIRRTSRYYFLDNGVRNALIGNFNPPDTKLRPDVGALWENWLVMERLKKQHYTGMHGHNYFWRTYDQKEIDWVEERDGQLFGYEFSWQGKQIRPATVREFTRAYPGSQLEVISREDYREFVGA